MHVLDDPGDRLMLVHDTIDPNPPHRRAAERREQHAAHCIAERVPEAALERLQAELGHIQVVLALGCLNQLRADKPTEIDRGSHDF
jgi:hypothetical protein